MTMRCAVSCFTGWDSEQVSGNDSMWCDVMWCAQSCSHNHTEKKIKAIDHLCCSRTMVWDETKPRMMCVFCLEWFYLALIHACIDHRNISCASKITKASPTGVLVVGAADPIPWRNITRNGMIFSRCSMQAMCCWIYLCTQPTVCNRHSSRRYYSRPKLAQTESAKIRENTAEKIFACLNAAKEDDLTDWRPTANTDTMFEQQLHVEPLTWHPTEIWFHD